MILPYEAARARVLLGEAYMKAGSQEDATLQLQAACQTFEDLGAKPDLEGARQLLGQAGT
jgi:hypothetical protein